MKTRRDDNNASGVNRILLETGSASRMAGGRNTFLTSFAIGNTHKHVTLSQGGRRRRRKGRRKEGKEREREG